MNPQSLNRYSYCLNNPLKYIDPSGYETTVINSDGQSKTLTDEEVAKLDHSRPYADQIDWSGGGNHSPKEIYLTYAPANGGGINFYNNGDNLVGWASGYDPDAWNYFAEVYAGLAGADACGIYSPRDVLHGNPLGSWSTPGYENFGSSTEGSIAMALIFLIMGGRGEPGKGQGQSRGGLHSPTNIAEEMAFRQVASDPEGGYTIPVKWIDNRWPPSKGWSKMGQNAGNYELHYQYNYKTKACVDLKIVRDSLQNINYH
jgi:hypothetical protein